MSEQPISFATRGDTIEIERGTALAPKFDSDGLIPAVATDVETGEVLMLAYMNAEAFARSIASGEAHYYSRSRRKLWKKGETSGHTQTIEEIRIDCDQDAIWLRVRQSGPGACHVGYRSCFYRRVQRRDRDGQPVLKKVLSQPGAKGA